MEYLLYFGRPGLMFCCFYWCFIVVFVLFEVLNLLTKKTVFLQTCLCNWRLVSCMAWKKRLQAYTKVYVLSNKSDACRAYRKLKQIFNKWKINGGFQTLILACLDVYKNGHHKNRCCYKCLLDKTIASIFNQIPPELAGFLSILCTVKFFQKEQIKPLFRSASHCAIRKPIIGVSR